MHSTIVSRHLVTENFSFEGWNRFVGAREPYERTCEQLPPHPSVLQAADNFARGGRERDALRLYERLGQIAPEIELDPKKRLGLWRRQKLVETNITPEIDDLRRALATYPGLHELADELDLIALSQRSTLQLCLWPLLLGARPEEVLGVCDTAVELLPGDAMSQQARGLARAVHGDLGGAIEDFQAAIEGWDDEDWRQEKEAWITQLEAGKNPIDKKVLARLRQECLG